MSFVSIIASSEFASVVSDGCLSDLDETGRRVIVPGSRPSFVRVSECQLIACTGSARSLKQVKAAFPFRKEGYAFGADNLATLEKIIRCVPYHAQDALIAIVNAEPTMSCRMISNEDGQGWQTLRPESDRFAVLFLGGRELNEDKMKQIYRVFNQQIKNDGQKNPQSIFSAQKDVSRLAAELDSSVNKRIFHQLIRKG
ncbi:hypothetical protein EWI07_11735 [Sporolactobacillus sp. THM7-4]|nr:hypothetical protein EWI07_11735 [Sporolactobacillus sp. THM7-4]